MHSDGRISHGLPCSRCRRFLINAGIKEVVTIDEKEQIIKYSVDDWISEDSKAYIDNLKKIRK
jgi:deoxycytidylate deaminase